MAKVRNTTSSVVQGGASASAKKVASNEVLAVKNGEERTFTRQIWDNLPADKDQWAEVKSKPATVNTKQADDANNQTGADNTSTEGADKAKQPSAKELRAAAAAEYVKVFGEEPAQDLATDDIHKLIIEKAASDAGKGDNKSE